MNYTAIPSNIMARLEPQTDGCLMWPGATTNPVLSHIYGVVNHDGKLKLVHRVVYETAVGAIPAGHHVHHECGETLCANPNHLRALSVTAHIGAWHRAKTHCPQGHPYDEANTRIRPDGARVCRTCERERMRRKRAA